ncbi:MAG TPA: S8 family serine peptidase [Caldisericia bacterium]|nr:S8 family serine peptidase [Caldisericia bacterium]
MKLAFIKFVVVAIVFTVFFVPIKPVGSFWAFSPSYIEKISNFTSVNTDLLSASTPITVIVKCRGLSVVEKRYSLRTLLSNNTLSKWNEGHYMKKLENDQKQVVDSLLETKSAKLLGSWQYVFNGFAVSIPGYTIPFIAKNPHVEKVFLDDKLFYPVRDITIQTIGRNDIPSLKSYQETLIKPNPDIRLGIVDSGIDYQHPDFYPTGFSTDESKVAGGWDCYFPEEDLEKETPGDPDPIDDSPFTGGHGTHVAGIAAANNPTSISLHGICPDATLYAYKVFPSNHSGGAPSYTLITACEYAVRDQCSVINLSLGHPGENPSIADDSPYYDAFQATKKSGVMIVAAAGNGGSRTEYNAWPIDAPGVFSSILQVAASDDRLMQPFTIHTPIHQTTFFGQSSRFSPPFTSDLDGLDIVYCGFGSKDECNQTDLQGKIAFIQRGPKDNGITFFEKNLNAKEAGAKACIIFNYEDRSFSPSLVVEGIADPNKYDFLPCMMVSAKMEETLQGIIDGFGYISFEPKTSLISSYTSAGPCFSGDEGYFKPEITAPGTSIYSAVPSFKPEDPVPMWGKKQGTSMATPVIAGCAAILRYANPSLSIDEITALMMNTSSLLKNPLTNTPFSFLYQGAGQIDLQAAMESSLIATPPSIMMKSESIQDPVDIHIKNTSTQTISGRLSSEILSHQDFADGYIAVFDKPYVTIDPHSTETIQCWLYPNKENLPDFMEGVVWIEILPDEHNPNPSSRLHIPFMVSKSSIKTIKPPISDISLSVDTFHMNKDNFGFLSFQLNSGTITRSIFVKEDGSVSRSIDKTRNYAEQVFLYIYDEYGNQVHTIHFGETIPIGRYTFFWDGYNIYKQPFLPDGSYYFRIVIPYYEEIYHTTVQNDKETYRKVETNTRILESDPLPFSIQNSNLPPYPFLEICTPKKVRAGEIFELEIKLHNAYEGLFDVFITFDPWIKITGFDEKQGAVEVQKGTNTVRLIHHQRNASSQPISYAQLFLQSVPNGKDHIPSFIIQGTLPYQYPSDILKKHIHPTVILDEEFLLGDFNENGTIDEEDRLMFQQNLGKTSKDNTWNPIFDCFQDDKINLKDLYLIGKELPN